jgi:hypothetical protein
VGQVGTCYAYDADRHRPGKWPVNDEAAPTP